MENGPAQPTEAEFVEALRHVASAFDRLGIDYALGGSFASGIHGEARATRDVDLVAAVFGRHAAPLAEALRSDFYVDESQIASATQNQGAFNLIHLRSMSKVDVFVNWRTEFGRTQLARKRRTRIGSAQPLDLYVASPEDTILAKLDWYRQGQGLSDRQWRDVLGVLKVQAAALDRIYLLEWAHKMDLTELLRRAFTEAGLPLDS